MATSKKRKNKVMPWRCPKPRTATNSAKIRYAVYPGHVRSRNDRESHYITFEQLCGLYKVNQSECLDMSMVANREGCMNDLIPLRVSANGCYELPSHPIVGTTTGSHTKGPSKCKQCGGTLTGHEDDGDGVCRWCVTGWQPISESSTASSA